MSHGKGNPVSGMLLRPPRTPICHSVHPVTNPTHSRFVSVPYSIPQPPYCYQPSLLLFSMISTSLFLQPPRMASNSKNQVFSFTIQIDSPLLVPRYLMTAEKSSIS